MKAPVGLHLRQEFIDGMGPWMWREADHWGWGHPLTAWPALRDAVLKHAKKRSVIVQAGGCQGMYPRLWSEYFKTVYTFEPNPINFYCLVANCPSERIVKVQAALGEKGGVGALGPAPEFNAGMFQLRVSHPGTTLIISLDDLNLPAVDVLQLDCEGSEDGILRGARELIAKHLPLITVEKASAGVFDFLGAFGYKEVARCGPIPAIADIIFSAA